MRRHLLILLTGLSLLLCAAVAVFWVRGYWVSDELGWAWHRADGSRLAIAFGSGRGGLGAGVSRVPSRGPRGSGHLWRRHATGYYGGADWPSLGRGGMGFYVTAHANPATGVHITGGCAPAPLAFAAVAALPALAVRRWLARRDAHPGLCPRCGYDLRATPERCPECGGTTACLPAA